MEAEITSLQGQISTWNREIEEYNALKGQLEAIVSSLNAAKNELRTVQFHVGVNYTSDNAPGDRNAIASLSSKIEKIITEITGNVYTGIDNKITEKTNKISNAQARITHLQNEIARLAREAAEAAAAAAGGQ